MSWKTLIPRWLLHVAGAPRASQSHPSGAGAAPARCLSVPMAVTASLSKERV